MGNCPVCGSEVVIEQDWALGRILRCGTHYRRTERFDVVTSPHLLDSSEIDKENQHAA